MATAAESSEAPAAGMSVRTWLFNPFHYVAGWPALGAGLAVVVAAGLIGSISRSHVDGVLDFHTGRAAPLWLFGIEGPIDWLVLSLFLLIAGKLISASRVRTIDVLGTQALARVPTLVTAVFALLPGYGRFGGHIEARFLNQPVAAGPPVVDCVQFGVVAVVTLAMIVWMVALMYRAYTVSCNVRGGKAIGTFIGALVLAEALSKVTIIALLSLCGQS